MTKKLTLATFFYLMVSCNTSTKNESTQSEAKYFEKMQGCFLLYNLKTDKIDKIIGDENCRKQYPACSTFKVPLAVMAFDSGILKDESIILKWDGKKDVRKEANRDHNAKTWMKESIVWFSQKLTPKLGQDKFQNYLDKFEYGNKDISAGLLQAWLISPASPGTALKISAYEQLDFMKKLWTNSLPANKKAMKLTQEITYLETSPNGFKMNGKTGSNFYDHAHKVRLGWFISHIERGDQKYITVANFRDINPTEAKGFGGAATKEITKKILSDLKLW